MKEVVRRSISYAAALQIADRHPRAVLSRGGRDRSPMCETHDERTGYGLSDLRTRRFLVHDPCTRVVFHRSDRRFTGWVEASGNRYSSGTLSGDTVTINDDAAGAHFLYRLV